MTPQEAIETIKVAIAEVEWDYSMDYTVAFEEAIKALEKQIPKKPSGDYHSVPHYRCPNCNREVVLYKDSTRYPYCKYCGQRLDWEGIE